jgi:hypothetical protein
VFIRKTQILGHSVPLLPFTYLAKGRKKGQNAESDPGTLLSHFYVLAYLNSVTTVADGGN